METKYTREGTLLIVVLPTFTSDLEVDEALRPLNDHLQDRSWMRVVFDLTDSDAPLYETVCGRVLEYTQLLDRHGRSWEVHMAREQLLAVDPPYIAALRPRVPAMATV